MMVKNSHKRLSHTSIALMVPLVRTPKCVHEAFIYENHTQKIYNNITIYNSYGLRC